jgi:CRISPR system Cascade subunit CasA
MRLIVQKNHHMAFNLTTEPWIPCVMAGGSSAELSLVGALARAHQISELFDQSPLVTVALHRLLLAILHRNFGPASTGEWFQLWRQGRWNEEKLGAYFTQWHDRFELFHPERPFYQVAEIADAGRQPVSSLFQELATGNNTTLFDHSCEDTPTLLDPAQAARGLVGRQAFSVGFGKSLPFYFSDSPLLRGFSVLVTGENLFETLALNLIRYDRENPIPATSRRDDLPAWEQEQPEQPRKEGTVPAGYLDYLTWQSRRIHLYTEGDPSTVRECQLQQGLKLADPTPADPFKYYRKDPKRGPVAVSFREERALWRDSHALFQAAGESYKRPAIFNWLAQLASLPPGKSSGIKPAYRFAAFGLATDEGKAASVTLWRQERLPLPLAYLEDLDLLGDLGLALAYAEDVGQDVRGSAWTFAKLLLTPEGASSPLRREVIEPISRSLAPERRYWPVLESPFLNLMKTLPDLDAGARDAELLRWRKEVRTAALEALEDTVRDLNASTRELKAVAITEREFRRNLRRGLETQETL